MKIDFDYTAFDIEDVRRRKEELMDSPEKVAAMLVLAMKYFFINDSAAYELLDILNGPEKYTKFDGNFIKDRIIKNPSLVDTLDFSQSDGEVSVELTPAVIEEATGEAKCFIRAKDGKKDREVRLKKEGGKTCVWYVSEWSSLLLGA